LEHLLTMSSGMLIREDFAYSDPRNELNQMWHAPDPVRFALVVLPEADMVVVITGGAWNMAPNQAPVKYNDIIGNYILRTLE